MKKFMMIACAALLTAQPLLAQEAEVAASEEAQVYDLEEGAMTMDSVQLETESELKGRNGGAIVGGIIGGIIGAIAADQIRRDHDRDHHDGRHPIPREYVCYAENRRGELFRAVSFDPNRAQDRALDKCEQVSLRCRPMGCQVIRR